MGSYGNENVFSKLSNLANGSALAKQRYLKDSLADSCYNKYHDSHKLCDYGKEPRKLLGSDSCLSPATTARELYYRATLECQRTRLPKVELAVGLADIDATDVPPPAAKSSRGFRGVLPLDASHVKAATKRKSIAMRVYGDQLPLVQRDLQVIKSEKQFSVEKRTATSSGKTRYSLPTLVTQSHSGLGRFPLENQSFVDLCRRSSAFTPRIPIKTRSAAFRISSTCVQTLPQSASIQGIPHTCSMNPLMSEGVQHQRMPQVAIGTLLGGPKYKTASKNEQSVRQTKAKRQLMEGFFARKSNQENCQEIPETKRNTHPEATPPEAENPEFPNFDSAAPPSDQPRADEASLSPNSSEFITADELDSVEEKYEDKAKVIEKPIKSNSCSSSCDTNNENLEYMNRVKLPALHRETCDVTPEMPRDAVTSLPSLTTSIGRRASTGHDADDEGESEVFGNLKYRCPASRDQGRVRKPELSQTELPAVKIKDVAEKDDGTYKKFARSKRKNVKMKRKSRSPHEVASESSTNLAVLAQKKTKPRKKGKKKNKCSQSQENLSGGKRIQGQRNAFAYESDPLNGDNELDDNDG